MLGTSATTRAASRSDVADAVMKGDRAALRALIQQKADVSAPQIDGATALHWAVYRDDLESADLLIALVPSSTAARATIKCFIETSPRMRASQFGEPIRAVAL